MSLAARRRVTARVVLLDRSLERLPLFRLSDSADDSAISCSADDGGRWRVLPSPGDRLPGTFDQDVYVELMHRFHEAGEPGDGAITFTLHANLAGRFTSALSVTRYLELDSPVARRLYRLLEVARAEGVLTWRVSLDRLKELLPLMQRYPSHLQRVLQPAHEMLESAGVVRSASVRQQQREWFVDYVLAARGV